MTDEGYKSWIFITVKKMITMAIKSEIAIKEAIEIVIGDP